MTVEVVEVEDVSVVEVNAFCAFVTKRSSGERILGGLSVPEETRVLANTQERKIVASMMTGRGLGGWPVYRWGDVRAGGGTNGYDPKETEELEEKR